MRQLRLLFVSIYILTSNTVFANQCFELFNSKSAIEELLEHFADLHRQSLQEAIDHHNTELKNTLLDLSQHNLSNDEIKKRLEFLTILNNEVLEIITNFFINSDMSQNKNQNFFKYSSKYFTRQGYTIDEFIDFIRAKAPHVVENTIKMQIIDSQSQPIQQPMGFVTHNSPTTNSLNFIGFLKPSEINDQKKISEKNTDEEIKKMPYIGFYGSTNQTTNSNKIQMGFLNSTEEAELKIYFNKEKAIFQIGRPLQIGFIQSQESK